MPCPNASVLRDFQLERLSAELHERISGHVSRCTECARAVRRRAPRPSRELEAVQQDSLIGTRAGEYDLVQRIGHGGMGVVYLGRHPLIGKEVAVKVLRQEAADNADHARRMLKEAQAVNAIQHRAIVDIFGFGELPDGRHYLVMEFLRGEPLNDWFQRTFPAPVLQVLDLVDVLCGALSAAHGARVVHRDLKPSNLFIREDEHGGLELKLLDFGLAKRESEKTSGRTLGTPNYMAPEQIHQASPITAQTDLYSLGVLLYELLTGELPYGRKEDIASILRGHLEEAPRPPRSLRPELPEPLEHLVLELLEKDPSHRPSSADEVRRRLREIRPSLEQAAPQPRLPRRTTSLPMAPAGDEARPPSRPQARRADDVPRTAGAHEEPAAAPARSRVPWRPLAAVAGVAAAGALFILAWPHLVAQLGSSAESPAEPNPEESAAASPSLPAPLPQPKVRPQPAAPRPAAPAAVQAPRPAVPAVRSATPGPPPETPTGEGQDPGPSAASLRKRVDTLTARLKQSVEREEDVDTSALAHLARLRGRLDQDDSAAGRAAVSRGLDDVERLYLAK